VSSVEKGERAARRIFGREVDFGAGCVHCPHPPERHDREDPDVVAFVHNLCSVPGCECPGFQWTLKSPR
jgi:hypothetical protein